MNNFAYLKSDSPFVGVFPSLKVPIQNILIPTAVSLEGSEEAMAYMVDLLKCSEPQRVEIARILAEKAGAPVGEVLRQFMERGLPLRVSQTTGCETDVPWFL